MNDKSAPASNPALLATQIRTLRSARGWTLAQLARRAGTSAPTLHRYESGWDRFELATLRRIAGALGASLEIRLRPMARRARPTRARLVELLRPLFWDKPLVASDLTDHRSWVVARVLMFADRDQLRAARDYFGDDAIREALARREIDARTRAYWDVVLSGRDAS
jgi:transcriptional regulator with XRE-family HTH domain